MSAPVSLEGMEQIPDPLRRPAPAVPAMEAPAEASPTRADRARWTVIAIGLAAAWIAAVLGIKGVRDDIATPAAVGPLAVWVIAVAAGLGMLLRPRARGLPAGLRTVQHTLWITPALYAAVVLMTGTHDGPPFGWSTIKSCLMLSHVLAAAPLAAAAILLRRTFLSAAGWRGAAIGGLAGLVGSLGVHAHCPVPALDHLLAAHGPSILFGAIAGGILGRARGSV